MSMTKEEKEAIKILEAQASTKVRENQYLIFHKEATVTVLNLIQKQEKTINKLKRHNKELLRKLRNRVKEVKKLTKYSFYKKEFATLNKKLKEKNKQIDLSAEFIKNNMSEKKIINEICIKGKCNNEECHEDDLKECIKLHFEKLAKEKGE